MASQVQTLFTSSQHGFGFGWWPRTPVADGESASRHLLQRDLVGACTLGQVRKGALNLQAQGKKGKWKGKEKV